MLNRLFSTWKVFERFGVALAMPAFSLHTAVPGLQGLPHKLGIVRTLDRIQTAFPGGPTPAQVVLSGRNVDSPQVQKAIASLKRDGLASGQIKQPITVDVSVQFRGGLLSQFYPDAVTNIVNAKSIPFINDKTLGTLKWTGVRGWRPNSLTRSTSAQPITLPWPLSSTVPSSLPAR